MLLKLRLETLWDYVDYFVISEAVYTQVGQPKPLNFDINQFHKYREKIRYLVVDHYPPGELNFWKNENYQRNYLINGLYDAKDEDWILVSDLDEIPRPEMINQYCPEKYKRGDFQQKAYVYRLNNLSVQGDGTPAIWQGSKVTTYGHLKKFFKTATEVRSYKSSGLFRGLRRIFFKKCMTQKIQNGGWHFTWILSVEKLILKLESIAEQQHNKEEFKNPQYIHQQIESGLDVIDSRSRYVAQAINEEEFPKYLVNHIDQYRDWIRPTK